MSREQVNDIFNRVTFDDVDRALHYALYNQMKDIAELMDMNAPDSADKTLAFRSWKSCLR